MTPSFALDPSLLALGRGTADPGSWLRAFGSLPSEISITPTNPFNTDKSTEDTIGLMNRIAQRNSNHPYIKEAIEEIRNKCGGDEDEERLIEETYKYVKDKVTFVEDEELLKDLFGIDGDADLIIEPARLLSMPQPMGDCDCHSTLIKSLLLGMGINSEFVTIAAEKDNPNKWSHVYPIATTSKGDSYAMDASHGDYVGWEASEATRKGVWVKGDKVMDGLGQLEMQALSGLGQDSSGDFGGETSIPTSTDVISGGGTDIITGGAYGSAAGAGDIFTSGGTTTGSSGGGGILTSSGSSGGGGGTSSLTSLFASLGLDATKIAQLSTLPAGYTLNAAGQAVPVAYAGNIGASLASVNPLIWVALIALIGFGMVEHK
jgi:hypothetical protein